MTLLNRFKSKLSSAITETPEEDVEELAEDDDKGWSVNLVNLCFCFDLLLLNYSLICLSRLKMARLLVLHWFYWS